jgi:hypothetical protein
MILFVEDYWNGKIVEVNGLVGIILVSSWLIQKKNIDSFPSGEETVQTSVCSTTWIDTWDKVSQNYAQNTHTYTHTNTHMYTHSDTYSCKIQQTLGWTHSNHCYMGGRSRRMANLRPAWPNNEGRGKARSQNIWQIITK